MLAIDTFLLAIAFNLVPDRGDDLSYMLAIGDWIQAGMDSRAMGSWNVLCTSR